MSPRPETSQPGGHGGDTIGVMAWYPKAVKHNLGLDTSRTHQPVRVTLHTAVSNARNLYSGGAIAGTYAHFYIGQDGTVYQYQDTARPARADLNGNSGTISVETWDGAGRRALTDAQVSAFAQLLAWAWTAHSTIPRRIATWDNTRGLAWHRLGCQGNYGPFNAQDRTTWSRAQTGAVWSNARGKECPWAEKIRQIDTIYNLATGRQATSASAESTTTASNLLEEPMYIIRRSGDGAHYLVTPHAMRHMGSPDGVNALVKLGVKIVDMSPAETVAVMSEVNLQAAAAVQLAKTVEGWDVK